MPVPSANLISTFMYHNTLRSDESVHKRMYTGDIYRTCFKQLKNVHSAWIAYDAYGERQQEEVTVCTVDAAQGKENEIVILSMVRSNFENKVGFLSDRRRLNVAMSRHRKCLFVVGDLPCFMRSNCLDLKTIIGIMKEQKVSVTFYSCPQYSSPTPMFTETISEFLLRLGLV
ncbi:unnamed protein product [Orchesella dallaii]|uniref:DNA2/NAM7 helicase-like C-terminal domain-containing protein n=1 Tax=Orchesella dallaii TaxID=48710 RepID=A0ABP1PSW4_9HEXA